MNLFIKRKTLVKYLNFCNEVIDDNQSNPLLTSVLIKVKKDHIEFICSNNYINSKFILNKDFELTGDEFNFLIKLKQFNTFISKMNSDNVEINKSLNKNIKIRDSNLECDLNIFDENDYPVYNFNTIDKQTLKVKLSDIKKIKELIIPNCSTNIEQLKPINGVNFEKNNNSIYVVSTDTFKVSRIKLDTDILEFTEDINIYSKTFDKIYYLLSINFDTEELIPFIKKDNDLLIHTDTIKLNIKLISGNFPKTCKLFELKSVLSIDINKSDLYNAIERAKSILITEKVPVINIDIKSDKLIIETNSLESGYFNEEMNIKNPEQKQVSFKINGNYLNSLIKLFKNDELRLKIIANDKPIIIQDIKDPNFEEIILPIRG